MGAKQIRDDDDRALLRSLGTLCEMNFQQYEKDGSAYLWHQFQSYGEEAFRLLEEYGLIEPRAGGGWDWTALGIQVVDEGR